jgi:hypothetical protein
MPGKLLLSEEEAREIATKARPRRSKRETGFVVIPVGWRDALRRCDSRDTRSVAWALLEEAGNNYRGEALHFTGEDARRVQVTRRGRMAALRELEGQGLIGLQVRQGCDATVILLRMA